MYLSHNGFLPSLILFALLILTKKPSDAAVRCFTDSCHPDDSNCLLEGDSCRGSFCFLDIAGPTSNYKKINRGCLDKEFLKGEGDGCFIINNDLKRYFCQCRSDFCNDRVGPSRELKIVGDGRNASCDTGCSSGKIRVEQRRHATRPRHTTARPRQAPARVRQQMICKGKTGGPFCSYDPQNRVNTIAEYGESYYTPFGSFYGWPKPNTTICIRYTFPPFYFIRDAACFCDSDNCNRPFVAVTRSRTIDVGTMITCRGCFLDCNGVGEFCAPLDQICQNETTCRGHYCVTHAVIDRFTSDKSPRLAVLSQYCMNSTQLLNGTWHEMTFDSGRNGRTKVTVCATGDYCNEFNFTGLIIGEQPYGENRTDNNNVTIAPGADYALSTPNTGRMVKLRKLLNYLLESLLSSNMP